MNIEEKELRLTKTRIDVLHQLGIHDTDELFSYYPIRYEFLNTADIKDWKVKDHVTFEGKVTGGISHWGYGKKVNVKFLVEAFDRIIQVTIFNRPWAKNLSEGETVTVKGIYQGKDRVTATSYSLHSISELPAVTTYYSLRGNMRQSTIRASVAKVYEHLANEIRDFIPDVFIRKYRLLRKAAAIEKIHFPECKEDIYYASRTLKYEEFLRFFLAIQIVKNEDEEGILKNPKRFSLAKIQSVIDSLGFSLTEDQKKTLDEILKDMSSSAVMYRLVQGDVGCGKTVVAALSMYAAVESGMQAALLAPTEILVRQHLLSLQNILKETGCRIEALYAGMTQKEKEGVLARLEEGSVDIVVGTHSLLTEKVTFKNLGLVIADEQQRFGVRQRRALKDKGDRVDFILMSATPIPRTLANTLYGDMDISTIHTMPAGRKPPVTKYIHENSFRSVLGEVRELLKEGHQLYVICAAVEKNSDFKARDVKETAANLQKLFPEYKVAFLHGRMSSDEKDHVMNAFQKNDIQILVSTTVVEVGMNVVNATGMIIYDAERFGLSQLHQLRGRIQRGNALGKCWLLSSAEDEKAMERLSVMEKTNDGFEISFEDLRLRGPGDILGTRQAGIPDFILGNLIRDTAIIQQAQADAKYMTAHKDDPEFTVAIEQITEESRKSISFID